MDYIMKNFLTYLTGKVTGSSQGFIKHGKKHGMWFRYYEQGQLWWKCNFKDGLRDNV